MGVVVPPAVPLDELLLGLQDAEPCGQRGVQHELHACRTEAFTDGRELSAPPPDVRMLLTDALQETAESLSGFRDVHAELHREERQRLRTDGRHQNPVFGGVAPLMGTAEEAELQEIYTFNPSECLHPSISSLSTRRKDGKNRKQVWNLIHKLWLYFQNKT